ncbi:MAG: hypothetical protein CMH57_04275 [Myxococcales bacterium]|nr:hypothetical protein [Myxococcales bacterium]
MKRLMADFAATLRSAEVPVSTAEVLDAARAVETLDPLQRDLFRITLRATLIKSQRHHAVFERCFALFFDPEGAPAVAIDAPAQAPDDAPPSPPEELERRWRQQEVLSEGADAAEEQLQEALREMLDRGDPRALELIRGLATGALRDVPQEAREGAFTGLLLLGRRLQAARAVGRLREALRRFAEATAAERPALEEDAQRWLAARERRLDEAEALLVDDVRARATRTFTAAERQGLRGRNIVELYLRDRELLVEVMQRFVRKLATVHSRRLRRRRRGQLDIKRTLRASLRTGGAPVRLEHRRPKRRKGDLVILCDVSGSVRAMAQATLAMIHALAGLWDHIRVFAFTDDVEEISERFAHHDPEEVLRWVMEAPLFSAPRPSNYGRAFRRFEQRYGRLLGSRTTLMVLGDARNNGHLTEHHLVEGWQRRARRVLWLNPEPATAWDTGDSEASAYRPFCTEFRACTTLGQLEEFVAQLR